LLGHTLREELPEQIRIMALSDIWVTPENVSLVKVKMDTADTLKRDGHR
jgi:hypothetical protein